MIYHFANCELQNYFEEDGLPQIHHISDLELQGKKSYQAMHYHMDRLEIIYVVEGEGVHTVGENAYQTKAGDLILLNQKVPHEEKNRGKEGMRFYVCAVTGLHLKGMKENHMIKEGECPVIHTKREDEGVEQIFLALLKEGKRTGSFTKEICSLLAAALIVKIIEIKNMSEAVEDRTERGKEIQDGDIVKQVREYLDKNYLKKVNLNQIAEAVSVSSFYLDRMFKKETGISVTQYLIHRKLGHAQSLLTDTDDSVVKIAEMVGYDNPSYFSQLFKKKFGMTPKEYRENLGIIKQKRQENNI